MVTLTGYPLVHALGWTLLHFCWQGALVAGMLWCVLGLLGGRSSEARYGAACVAMLLMVALPLITFVRIASADYQARSAAHGLGAVLNMSLFLEAVPGDGGAPWPVRVALLLDRSMPWLLAAWMVGAIFFVVRLNLGLAVARRLRNLGVEAPSDELMEMFEGLRRTLGITRAVQLLHSARVQVPTVVGWLRPVVLIPVSCLTGLSGEQIEAIFCHELAHVRRHDYLVSVFQSLAEALLFYHPAVWWVSRQVRRERECCCDELAVAHGGDALAYARALSYLEERRAAFPEFVLGANGGVLTMRIKRLLGYSEDAGAPQFAALLLAALVVAIASSYVPATARAQKAPVASAAVAAPAAESVVPHKRGVAEVVEEKALRGDYAVWLKQDASYIITTAERDAFLRLTNDDERDAFIANFWKRRDTAGSPAGSYKAEYYSRMAYANEHFATDTRAGWRSDRGHVYMVYGRPDSIDAHPSGGEYPFEVWHYKNLAGVGDNIDMKFVDTCRCGDNNYTVDAPGQPGPASAEAVRLAGRIFAPAKVSRPAKDGEPLADRVQPIGVIPSTVPYRVYLAGIPPADATPAPGQAMPGVTPDMSCTFYGHGVGQEGVCEAAGGGYACRSNADGQVSQLQSSCEWKVKRFQNWAMANHMDIPDGPIRVSSGMMAGTILKKVNPVYPEIAKQSHVQGVVVLRATIAKDGTIRDLNFVSGPQMLASSAYDAVKQWTYKPYLLNGQPTEVQTTINVNYTFGEAAPPPDQQGQLGAAWQKATSLRDGAIAMPVLLHAAEPEFSQEARKAKVNGVVLVNLTVDKQGVPQNVHVVRRLGYGLDKKAVDAVSQYRFKPAMKDDKPVDEALNVEVNFQIF